MGCNITYGRTVLFMKIAAVATTAPTNTIRLINIQIPSCDAWVWGDTRAAVEVDVAAVFVEESSRARFAVLLADVPVVRCIDITDEAEALAPEGFSLPFAMDIVLDADCAS